MMRVFFFIATVSGLLVLTSNNTLADTYDLTLSRLCQIQLVNGKRMDCGGGYSAAQGAVDRVIADNAAFRSLMSEMGVVFAPSLLTPAATRGFAGFNISLDMGWTMINPKKLADDPAARAGAGDPTKSVMKGQHWYWRAANSVGYNSFSKGDITSDTHDAKSARFRLEEELPPSMVPTFSVMIRKGLWLPVPSFEIGVGVKHLIGSRMWGPVATAKIALAEGFQGWPIPAISVRGSGTRVVGTPDFNLTVAGLDFEISKHLGIASTFNITPYVGYQLLWIIADSEVLDATPGVDGMSQTAAAVGKDPMKMNQCISADCRGKFSFADQSNITRHRLFFGAKVNFYFVSLLMEYSLFTSGTQSSEVFNKYTGLPLDVPDSAGSQHNISLSLQMDY